MRKTKTGYAQKKRCQSRNRVVSPGGLWWRVYGGNGSVVTFVRCGGIYNIDIVANLLASQPVKEL